MHLDTHIHSHAHTHTQTHTHTHTHIHSASADASPRHSETKRGISESSYEMLHEVFSEGVSTYFYTRIGEKGIGEGDKETTKTEKPSR